MIPAERPVNPNFSSGPCSKRPGYDVRNLSLETLGRSHRSALGKSVLGRACRETTELLGLCCIRNPPLHTESKFGNSAL